MSICIPHGCDSSDIHVYLAEKDVNIYVDNYDYAKTVLEWVLS